uniref:Uncharacterized protein n=1 Tax=Sus scrofa TaxID=9823 RepID=A0A8D1FNF2_PIG
RAGGDSSSPGWNHPYMPHAVSPAPSRCHGKTGTFGARGITWDACVINHLTFLPSSPPPPESLPRTPELLAQGPVSLQPPEKHPGALAFIPYFFVLLSMCINY